MIQIRSVIMLFSTILSDNKSFSNDGESK